MSLSDLQWEHLKNIAVLVLYAERLGYKLTQGRAKQYYGDKYYTRTSQHNKALANDLNLFVGDKYLSHSIDHYDLGMFWESLSPHNRWGGRFQDGNHYETLEESRNNNPEKWDMHPLPQKQQVA